MKILDAKQPLISVIIPCYNVEQYLSKCVDSILRQSYQNLEIWLVDDGSPDNCGLICDYYAKQDNRVRVIHKVNGGLSDARNVAIDQATGEWITFVDSDDYVAEDYVETLLELAINNNSKVSISDFVDIKEDYIPKIKQERCKIECKKPYEALEQILYQKRFDHNAWGKLYHKSLFADGIRYPKGLVFEDFATTYRLLLKSNSVSFINKVTYFYLLRDSSIEGIYNPKKVNDGLEVISMIERNVDLIKPVIKAYKCRKFSFFLHLLLQMPDDAEHCQELMAYVKDNRLSIMFDWKARMKTRISAIVSYAGLNFLKTIFNHFSNKR